MNQNFINNAPLLILHVKVLGVNTVVFVSYGHLKVIQNDSCVFLEVDITALISKMFIGYKEVIPVQI